MTRARSLALSLAAACALSACAGSPAVRRAPAGDLPARLAARARSLEGHAGGFKVGEARFQPDCIGFVQAVYEAEGIPLRRVLQKAAPRESSGVAAAYAASRDHGLLFGGGGARPAPGDLVFFHDTYDRNRNGHADDPFTHIGIVTGVEDGRVTFLHRGGKAVVLATLDPSRPALARDADGRVVNSTLRDKRAGPVRGNPGLAGALFAGYGRLDPARLPRDLGP